MSHYVKGKLKVKCSIDIMRRALIAVMPTWAKHIQIDEGGRIPLYDYNRKINTERDESGREKVAGYHIMVPSPKNPNYAPAPGNVWADLGLKQNPDKTWEVTGDWGGMGQSGMSSPQDLEMKVGAQIARMKAEAWAKFYGAQVRTEDSEERIRVEITVSGEAAKKIKQKVSA